MSTQTPHTDGRQIELGMTVIADTAGRSYDVRISAAGDSTWSDIRAALLSSGRPVPDPAYIEAVPLGEDSRFDSLANGSLVAPIPSTPPRQQLLSLACIHGPQVGESIPLQARGQTIGRHPRADLVMDDPDLSRLHCEVRLESGRVTVVDLQSTNGTVIESEPVDAPRELRSGESLLVGNSQLRLSAPSRQRPQAVRGWIDVQRPPVRLKAPVKKTLSEPTPVRPRERRAMPWLVALLPLIIGVGLALWLRTAMFLAFAVFSPVMMLAQHLSDKRDGRRTGARDADEHAEAMRCHRSRLRQALDDERRVRARACPSLADAVAAIRAVDGRLWHKHPNEHGYLHWRLGTGTISSRIEVTDADSAATTALLDDAPVAVDLVGNRLSAVVAEPTELSRLLESLLLQLSAWHSPHLVPIAIVHGADDDLPDDLRWLPHLRSGRQCHVFDASRPTELDDFVAALERPDKNDSPEQTAAPRVVLVLLDSALKTGLTALADVVADPAAFGCTVVCLTAEPERLPDRAFPVVTLESTVRGRLTGDEDVTFVPDLPGPQLFDATARLLAPVRDRSPERVSATLPDSCDLHEIWRELHHSPLLDPVALQHIWNSRRRADTVAVLGRSGAGAETIDLDIDGPHALIAGTTGAGKSELLQTFVAGLAAANPPSAMNFVLIDYKGGAAFRECAGLPHTVGMVTDLDGHLTERALTSLGAELHRRERLLAAAGAKDLHDYHRDPSRPTIPRLVLVIDEFRVLSEELPDFVDGLVRLATVGRSLGVHLVLATQRPTGVVSADIRANVNLRVALRVRDDGDSQDVIESGEAARLSTASPGRAYLRSGSGELRLFQAARVTVAPKDSAKITVGPLDGPPQNVAADDERTILAQLGPVLHKATRATGAHAPKPPWLAPLPSLVGRKEADGTEQVSISGDQGPGYLFALGDRPQQQDQPALRWAPLSDQHLAVVGGPRSGRSSMLRTLLTSFLTAASQPHLYLLDLGHSLSAFGPAESVGALVHGDEPNRIEAVLDWLGTEIDRRRRSCDRHQQIVLVIDGWDTLVDLAEEVGNFRLLDLLGAVLRDGPAADVHVVATGGRALMTSRLLPLFRSQLVLAMADNDDIAMMGVPRSDIPSVMPAGRALAVPSGLEMQIIWPGDDPPADAELADGQTAPHRIAGLPELVRPDDLDHPINSVAIGAATTGTYALPLGPRGDLVALVGGPSRSGRTVALRGFAAALSTRPVCWLTSTGSPPPDNAIAAASADELITWLGENRGGVVLVDDVEAFVGTDIDDVLADHAARAAQTGAVVIASGLAADLASNYRGVVGEVRRRGIGVLLMPGRSDGELFGLRCPSIDRPRPGRGFAVLRGELTPVQIACVPATFG